MFSIILVILTQVNFHFSLSNSLLKNPIKIENEFLIQFNNGDRSGNFSNFFHYHDSLFVTGTNYVYKLNPLNISERNPNFYREVFINPSNHLSNNSKRLKNHIKLLIFRERSQDLIICGTNLGKPHIKDLNVKDFSSIVEFDGFYLCPGVEEYKNLGHISYENPGNSKASTRGLMYSAIWKTDTNIYGEFARYGIYRQEIDLASKILKTLPDQNWLWEPDFISIIDHQDKIFYFFTEYSIEEFSLTKKIKRISRVARVCKSDEGLKSQKNSNLNNLWLTFRKINFNCENKYNNLVLVKQAKQKLIALFYDEEQGSIICETGLEQVKEMLENKNFWINRNHVINKENFHFYNEDFDCENIPKVNTEIQFHGNKIGEDEFLNELSFGFRPKSNSPNYQDQEILNEFLTKNTILDSHLIASVLLKLPVKITCISYEDYGEEIFHFGTSDNNLILLKRNSTRFLEPILLDLSPWIKNGNLVEILVKKDNVYLGTTNSVFQIKYKDLFKKFCKSINECFQCEKIFFCTWVNNACEYEQTSSKSQNCLRQYKEINFTLGENLKLECIEGYYGQIKWKKNQNRIEQADLDYFTNSAGQLYLVNMTKLHSGIYTCVSELNEDLLTYQVNPKPEETFLKVEKINQSTDHNFKNLTSFIENFEKLIEFFKNEC
ncbi:Semaphorin-2A [Brachionus plicatilis]|uniref:Semaphorin-2A n=1 Tax=Brachionus plicatilis TaxID=10195 RepID=A0A3M7PA23_BRAPC|nr:Semaphorin-2A [Brachionus plicatilis]